MNEKDIEEKAEQFEAALEGLMSAMEELRKDRDRLKKLAERPRGRWEYMGIRKGKRGGRNSRMKQDLGTEWRALSSQLCTNCRKMTIVDASVAYYFCPHCGAEMENAEEEE